MTDNNALYQYIIPDTSGVPLAPRIRMQSEITDRSIRIVFNQWRKTSMRYYDLYRTYVGLSRQRGSSKDGTIDNWAKLDEDDNQQTLCNFCRYVVTSLQGYIIGNAPEYECEKKDEYAKAIFELFRKQNKQQVDAKIIKHMSTYGRAFELVYHSDDEDATPKSVVIPPKDAFVVYSGDVEEDSVFGCVRYVEQLDDETFLYRLYLYTQTDVQVWESNSEDGPWKIVGEPTPHGFGRVPLIEYVNNDEFMSDFEPIIALQNVYNRTLLNRVADVDAFVKSILVVIGSVLGKTPEEVEKAVENLNDLRVLHLDNDGSSASFLEKSMDESGVQILQDQMSDNIHKFAMVPDLSDEQFASNASGVAMAYKLFGTDQLVSEKVINFQKGFARRCKLYDTALNNPLGSPNYEPLADIASMHIKFRFNSPQDINYMATALTALVQTGILSKDSARRSLSIVSDADDETKKVNDEANAQVERNRREFEDDYSTTPDKVSDNPFTRGKTVDTDEDADDDDDV